MISLAPSSANARASARNFSASSTGVTMHTVLAIRS